MIQPPEEDTMTKLTADAQANHDLFVKTVKETGLVWGLKVEDDWAVCESNEYEDQMVFPFWSNEADARIHCEDEWAEYAPATIALDEFAQDWLVGMDEDGLLVGTNWDAELSGMEVEPMELAEALGYEVEEDDQDEDDADEDDDGDDRAKKA
jgi:hypothetical protein